MGTVRFSRNQLQEGLDYTDEQADLVPPSIIFGAESVSNAPNTRFLYPGNVDITASSSIKNMIATRSGTLRNLNVLHNDPDGNGNSIVYTVLINGTPSSLTVTMASTDSTGSDLVNTVAISAGNSIGMQAVKGSSLAQSPSSVVATMEMAI